MTSILLTDQPLSFDEAKTFLRVGARRRRSGHCRADRRRAYVRRNTSTNSAIHAELASGVRLLAVAWPYCDPPITDIDRRLRNVRFVSQADIHSARLAFVVTGVDGNFRPKSGLASNTDGLAQKNPTSCCKLQN
jgi:hypothetical protein